MGTVSGDLTVPVDAGLGYYSIQVHAAETTVQAGFDVEEYKKPEYEVRVTRCDAARAAGRFRYCHRGCTLLLRRAGGERNAALRCVPEPILVPHVTKPTTMRHPSAEQEQPESEDEQISDQEAKLNADGKFTFTFKTAVSEHKWDARYRMEARVTDAGNREISGSNSLIATYGSYWVSVEAEQYFLAPGVAGNFKIPDEKL